MNFNNKKINKKIAELAGIFAADGSMQKNHLCFWGNPSSDRDYYNTILKEIFLNEFKIKIRPHEKKSNQVYGFYVCDKNVINFFNKNLNFPFGKKTYSLEIPEKIYKSDNKEIKKAFIRGFFAGDGCLNFDKRYAKDQKILKIIHTYPRIQIRCVSQKIIDQISEILKDIGIKNFVRTTKSKKENEVDSYNLQVSGKIRLELWNKKIGFSSLNHSSRYEIFKKHGFVPSNTTQEERLKILKSNLNPWSFYPTGACSLAWIRRQKNE